MNYFFRLAKFEQAIRPQPDPFIDEFVEAFSSMVNKFAAKEMEMNEQIKQFLENVTVIQFSDSSSVESYDIGNGTFYRRVRSDGHTEIGFSTITDALAWVRNGEQQ